MRRANPYRKAILRIVRDEQLARPHCALVSSVGVDEDGLPYVHFSCLSHDSTWRYYVHVYVDTSLVDHADQLDSRCPAQAPADGPQTSLGFVELLEEGPADEAGSPGPSEPEVSDEIS